MLTLWELAKELRVQDNIPDNCACGFRVFNKLENKDTRSRDRKISWDSNFTSSQADKWWFVKNSG